MMTVGKYRHKETGHVIEAMGWNGSNIRSIDLFTGDFKWEDKMNWDGKFVLRTTIENEARAWDVNKNGLKLKTKNGRETVWIDDYIIKCNKHGAFRLNPILFETNYEPINSFEQWLRKTRTTKNNIR